MVLPSVATEVAEPGIMTVETIGWIRREHFVKGKGIRRIAGDLKVSRQTVRKAIAAGSSENRYRRETHRGLPQLGAFVARLTAVFGPLWFAPGEAYQFDFSHEVVVLGGVTTTVKVAHLRLCHSPMRLVVAYLRETQEMVFDAQHDRAFRLFDGACRRGIYNNLWTPPAAR